MIPHPLVSRAAEGSLPEWAVAGDRRRAHMARVAELMATWADALDLDAGDRTRWVAAAHLHDALRDEDPGVLRQSVSPAERTLPGPVLHGPAAAERIRVAGVLDGELLLAIAWHTLGDRRFGPLGRALYVADFLEPGRTYLPEWRAELRGRMPDDLDQVTLEVARARMGRGLERDAPLQARTVDFWNVLVREAA